MNNLDLDKAIKQNKKEIKSEMAQISILLDKILNLLEEKK
jgi:hypothetical protein